MKVEKHSHLRVAFFMGCDMKDILTVGIVTIGFAVLMCVQFGG